VHGSAQIQATIVEDNAKNGIVVMPFGKCVLSHGT